MKNDIWFVGLDLETTGLDTLRHRVIQIGMTSGGPLEPFVSDVGWFRYGWEDEALKVNRFTHARIQAGPAVSVVDSRAAKWLADIRAGVGGTPELIAVGWNVGTFDLPFLATQMSKTRAMLSRRTVDLNSLCFALHGVLDKPWDEWKAMAKKEAADLIAAAHLGGAPHDALYDAREALICFKFLSQGAGGRWL